MTSLKPSLLKGICIRGVLLGGMILLSGCQRVRLSQESSSVNTQPVLSTNTLEISLTASLTTTMTTTPTETATPTETSTPTLEPTLTPKPLPLLDQFIALIMNGNASQVVGVFIGDYLGLQVVQQPSGNAGFVSTQNEVVTYFTMVKNMTGNTGLLAHNYLAGIYYYDLYPGESVVLIYGDGSTEEFIVSDNEKYQALNPTNPTSDFVSVTSGERLSSTELFFRVYGGANRTTFQTCIAQGSESSWGRLFVIALQN